MFCINLNLHDCFVAVETRDALERRDLHVWQKTSGLFSGSYYTLDFVSSQGGPSGRFFTESPERKRASIPNPERMVQAAPTFGVSPSEKRMLDMVTDHPMIPRDHLARWLGVSEGRICQMMHSLVDTWALVERCGKRGDTRYTLSAEGIRHVTHRDCAQLPTTRGIWSTALTTDNRGRRRHLGHRIETWARQTKHADGITWFLSKLEAETRADPHSDLLWSVPTARSDRAYNWGQSAIAPDAAGKMVAEGLEIPFYLEYELNNEVGTIQDLPGIATLLRGHGVLFHCDAAQAPCAKDVSQLARHADLISLSGHKMYGPQGIGALYIRRDLQELIAPIMYGGGQQAGLRSGTVPVPLCVGMAAAAEIVGSPEAVVERERVGRLRDSFVEVVRRSGFPVAINGPVGSWRHPGNANLRFDGIVAQDILGGSSHVLRRQQVQPVHRPSQSPRMCCVPSA